MECELSIIFLQKMVKEIILKYIALFASYDEANMYLLAFFPFFLGCQKKSPATAAESTSVEVLKEKTEVFPALSPDASIEQVFGISEGLITLDRSFSLNYLLKSDPTQFLYLPELTSLTEVDAEKYAQFDGRFLSLNGLTKVTEEALGVLEAFQGSTLILSGLSQLETPIAESLANQNVFELYLNGVTTLDSEAAEALADFGGGYLSLGLKSVDADIATALSTFDGEVLSLNYLASLDATTAQILSQYKGGMLTLNALGEIDAPTAQALAGFSGDTLTLRGLQGITPEAAEALATFKGFIDARSVVMESVTKIALENRKAPSDFQSNDEELEKSKTASGVEYYMLKAGEGVTPNLEQRVRIHYIARDESGIVFDSSVARRVPLTVQIGRTLPGWTEGLQLMTVGSRYRFWVPEALAYQGRESLPKGTIVFDIELLEILP